MKTISLCKSRLVLMPEVRLVPMKIRIEGIMTMKSVMPRMFKIASLFFSLLSCFVVMKYSNMTSPVTKMLVPANRIGGISFVAYEMIIGNREYSVISPSINISPIRSLESFAIKSVLILCYCT